MPQPFDIEKMFSQTGRYIKENNKLVNLANIAERFDRNQTPLNALQVAESFPVISLKSNYGISDLRDKITVTGSGSVTNTVGDGKYVVATGTTPNSTAILESVERGRYVSGAIGLAGIGVRIPQDIEAGETIQWGYFDESDGCGYGFDNIGFYLFRRYLGVDTKIYRPDWDDPMDGAGPSGLTLAASNVDIYRMPFRWYGAGPIKYEVAGGGTNSDTVTVHVFEAPDGEPIFSDPNLPIRLEISNNGTGRDINAEVYGRQFSVLGKYEPNRRPTGAYRLSQSVGTTFVPLVSFRQKVDYASVSVKSGSFKTLTANADIILQVRIGGELTGATYTALASQNVPATETALEFDIDATAITGGQAIYVDLGDGGQGVNTSGDGVNLSEVDLPVFQNITLCARAISGTATVTSVFSAREEW